MSYLEDFKKQLKSSNHQKFFQLWEEYCTSDSVDFAEFHELLSTIAASEFASTFGPYVETALPLWRTIQDEKNSYEILRLLIDLETKDSPMLASIAKNALELRHGKDPSFQERLRIIGLRKGKKFQRAISNYELLSHMEAKGFVHHASGWGTGEVVEYSSLREEVVVEFENVMGKKSLSFQNSFRALTPLSKDHFYVRRFNEPDLLEEFAKKDPVAVMQLLLKDLGPKSALEIKELLCDVIIPEKEWGRWWQATRAKLKKTTFIEIPTALKKPFRLLQDPLSHEEIFHRKLDEKSSVQEIITVSYHFVRDLPDMLKKKEIKSFLEERLEQMKNAATTSESEKLQIAIFQELYFENSFVRREIEEFLGREKEIEALINKIEIIAFKKRALVFLRECRSDWPKLFLHFLATIPQSQLRDFLLKELNGEGTTKSALESWIKELLYHPTLYPEVFVWYFQKIIDGEALPYSDRQGRCQFLENFLILLNVLESDAKERDLVKKMHAILSGKRFLVVRQIIEGCTLEFIKEFLLLVSKCQSFDDHDQKILRSLAEVVHPSLTKKGKAKQEQQCIWTTEKGYQKLKDRIEAVGGVETIENSREIEKARSYGDLRENAEYKFALEKRARLQAELKSLSEQFHLARVITADDVTVDVVSVGCKVRLCDERGVQSTYQILGPWDADPENNVLSFQSKFAELLLGKKRGDSVHFKEDLLLIEEISSCVE